MGLLAVNTTGVKMPMVPSRESAKEAFGNREQHQLRVLVAFCLLAWVTSRGRSIFPTTLRSDKRKGVEDAIPRPTAAVVIQLSRFPFDKIFPSLVNCILEIFACNSPLL
jgi:hypothetical protein